MATPFTIACPSCQAKLKIQNPQAIGKKVRCPKCQNPLTVKAPARKPAPSRSAPPPAGDDAFDDYGDAPGTDDFQDIEDYGDGSFDDYEDYPAAPATRSRRRPQQAAASPAKKKKSRKRKRGAPAWQLPAMIGGGVLTLLLVAGLLVFSLAGGGDGNIVDMTYLPPNAEMIGYVDFDAVRDDPGFQKAMDQAGGADQMQQQIGVAVDDIETVTFGMAMPAGGPAGGTPEFTVVVRFSRDLDVEKLKTSGGLQAQDHNGQELLAHAFFPFGVWTPDSQTMVVGGTEVLKQAIDRGSAPTRRPEFDFVKGGQPFFFAVVPSDPTKLTPPPQQLEQSKQALQQAPIPDKIKSSLDKILTASASGFKGFAVGAAPRGSNTDVSMQVVCKDSATASQLAEAGQELVDGVRSFVNDNPQMIQQMVAQGGKGNRPDKVVSIINSASGSASVSQSGDAVTIAMTLPDVSPEDFGGGGGMPMRNPLDMFGFGGGGMGGRGFGGGGGGPAFEAGQAAAIMKTKNDLKQIGLALHNYHEAHLSLPVTKNKPEYYGPDGKPKLSWRVHILPFLEQQALYEQFHLDEPWDSPHNIQFVNRMPDAFRSPLHPTEPGKTCYLGAAVSNGIFGPDKQPTRFADVSDGLSNTLMVVEVSTQNAVTWTKPEDYSPPPGNELQGLGDDSRTFHGLLGDGSVQQISGAALPPDTLRNLFQMNDGNRIDAF